MTQGNIWQKATTSLSLVLLGSGLAIGGNYLINSPQSLAQSSTNNTVTVAAETSENPPETELEIPPNYISQVVNQVGDSVVRIDASRKVATRIPARFNDPFFRQFFGSQIPNIPRERIQTGLGSGFVVSSDGLILTNAHVIEGSESVQVTLKDGRSFAGQVMGTDPLTDVGVIKIEAENLPAVTFADSDALQPGEYAIAIGNPLGLDNTVTTGIVSGTGRSSSQVGIADKRVSFIQTDAAINPGNSGGPLLNAKGEVIGINTAIIRRAQGLGFAIPVNTARDIAEELIAKGKVDHPYLGIRMAAITPELKARLKANNDKLEVAEDQGVVVVDVVPNSPADRAGLQYGDIIQKIAQKTVANPEQIQQAVQKTEVGEELSLKIIRNGRTVNLEVQVGVLPIPQNAR
ncbi:MAG: HhoA/HhoB/HtrA family serine endopeptidase [Cyanobacteria bacterium J06621_8]